MRTVYLDYNATTPVAPPVQESMLPFLAEHFGCPSASHALGRAAHEAVEDSRIRVARLLGANRNEIVFTSGGTESNNMALWGVAMARAPGATGHLVISAVEHASVFAPAQFLESLGYGLTVVGCDRHGVVDSRGVAAAIRSDTVLVSVTHANDEIGVIEPVSEIAEVCHSRGVLLHVDAVQSAGKIVIDVDKMGADLVSLSGHKMYAPKGVGALFVRRGLALEPLMHGAGHEGGLRSGTQNVANIVALGQACSLIEKNMGEAGDRMSSLRDRLAGRLAEAVGPGLTFNAAEALQLPNTLSVNFPDANAQRLLARVPELCASSGCVGQDGGENMSPTLGAIGLSPDVAQGTVRLSLGWYTTEEEIDRAANLLLTAWDGVRL